MLKAENVTKIFRQGIKDISAVSDANLHIAKGERVYIYGPSGAGKSTLLHMLGGLTRPTSGEVIFPGKKNIYEMSQNRRSYIRNRHFGFVFQFFYLLPELNVLENIMMPAVIRGEENKKTIRTRANELLKIVRMDERVLHKPAQLSGGESQRVAVARALINLPDILFCDEPTGNLDSELRQEIYSLIKKISEKRKMSIVVVSHHLLNDDFFHSEYLMRDGKIEKKKTTIKENYVE
ncbi:MAG: ABC transporter ATP-binding protein [Candidatus Omnitrophota bacterium]